MDKWDLYKVAEKVRPGFRFCNTYKHLNGQDHDNLRQNLTIVWDSFLFLFLLFMKVGKNSNKDEVDKKIYNTAKLYCFKLRAEDLL